MLFAAFVQEKEPTRWSDLPAGLLGWVQDVGVLAAVILVPYLIAQLVRSAQGQPRRDAPAPTTAFPPILVAIALLGIAVGYLVALVGWLLASEGRELLQWGRLIGGGFSLIT